MTPEKLVRREACIAAIFRDEDKPSRRTWEEWKAQRMVPYVKLLGVCYYDPEAVRSALIRDFTVKARA
jgi:hypothetical protein